MADIKEISEQLEQGVKDVFASDKYTAVLDTMSKFYNYSANNCILIMLQKPEATYVASYKKWQSDFHRQVRKGETSIKIIAPIPHKAEREDRNGDMQEVQWMSYKAVPVFDISQTDGEELPTLCKKLTGDVEEYNWFMRKLVSCSPVPIENEDIARAAYGYFDSAANRIVVQSGLSQQQTIKTTVHEIAHAILHCKEGEAVDADRNTREVQAESVAYVVCKYLGIDTADYSFGYVAGWSSGKEPKELTASMELIRKTAKTIIDAMADSE